MTVDRVFLAADVLMERGVGAGVVLGRVTVPRRTGAVTAAVGVVA